MFTYPRFTNLFICYSRRFLTSDRENWCESMPQRQKNRRYFCQRQKDGCVRKVNTFRENGNAPCWDTEIVGKMASSPEGIENFLSVNFQNFYESTSSRSSSVYSSWKLVFQNNQNWKLGSSYSKSRKIQFSQPTSELDIQN